MRIALVACAKQKRKTRSQAKDLYTSPLFRALSRYAQLHADRWYILSAKFGVLPPKKIISPYDVTLNRMNKAQRVSWAEEVTKQLVRVIPPRSTVIILAGRKYRDNLLPFLRGRCATVKIPFDRLSFGKQLQRLSRLGLL